MATQSAFAKKQQATEKEYRGRGRVIADGGPPIRKLVHGPKGKSAVKAAKRAAARARKREV